MRNMAWDAVEPEFYLRLEPLARLEHGWRVAEVQMYPTEDCSGPPHKFESVAVPLEGDTYVFTAPSPMSHYMFGAHNDFLYMSKNLFDGNVSTEWWSATLNVNPVDVDATHTASVIEWAVKGNTSVRCVTVEQSDPTFAMPLRLVRGPASGDGCSTKAGARRCAATAVWEETRTAAPTKPV